jgi:hypothetical protein
MQLSRHIRSGSGQPGGCAYWAGRSCGLFWQCCPCGRWRLFISTFAGRHGGFHSRFYTYSSWWQLSPGTSCTLDPPCYVSYVFAWFSPWWFSLKPTTIANWQPDVDRPAWVERNGDQLIIHNLRNCDYRTETDYINCWSDRTVSLSDLRGADLFFTTWGVPWIGHPILSFQFGDGRHIAFSIEARYKGGQAYSAILGFFRQYEVIFVVADERDVIRLRTNFRKDEEVFLYRTSVGPETARAIFLTYVEYLNRLKDRPEWYNALTRNCTTAIDKQIAANLADPHPWNYRILLNGTLDRLLYERGRLVTDGLPFHELKSRAHINTAARAADNSPDFSSLVRAGRPGFENK